jgi:hypothetical protein
MLWILAVLAALAAVSSTALLLNPSFPWVHALVLQKEPGLAEDQSLSARTLVDSSGVHKGDAFPYVVEVWYDRNQVSEVDKVNLDKAVNLKPFEVRDVRETEFDLDARTRVYRREYEIQLIEGQVDYLHKFPTIVVQYKRKDSDGFTRTTVDPKPIFIASRLPDDSSGLELRPLQRQVEDPSQEYLPWILWALGGFVGVVGAGELAWRAIPQWREVGKQRKGQREGDALALGYRSLCAQTAAGAEPRRSLRQMERLLRIVLARKEKAAWLNKANPDQVPAKIRPSVLSLLEKGQKAYGLEQIEPQEAEQALKQLEEVLAFYFGGAEVRAWRS